MLQDIIKTAALRAAAEYREEGDFAKVRFAVWLARRAAGVKPLETRVAYADSIGCVHIARTGREASLLAHETSCAYV